MTEPTSEPSTMPTRFAWIDPGKIPPRDSNAEVERITAALRKLLEEMLRQDAVRRKARKDDDDGRPPKLVPTPAARGLRLAGRTNHPRQWLADPPLPKYGIGKPAEKPEADGGKARTSGVRKPG